MSTSEQALVFDVQRFSLHDGPGVRTVVFFKGCGLDCRWCQNPEGKRGTPELAYHRDRCIQGCDACISSCPEQALSREMDARVDWDACTHCGECVASCPSRALSMIGQRMGVAELVDVIAADLPFFRSSGGGVTFSGGEPVLHAPVLAEVLPKLRELGIHVTIETSGEYRFDQLEPLLPAIDRLLFDLKAGAGARHLELVGRGDETIMANLRALVAHPEAPEVELRMPVVPGLNDDDQAIDGIATKLRSIERDALTLLPYNHLWEAKLPRLDTKRVALGIGAAPSSHYAQLVERFAKRGIQAHVAGSSLA